MLYAPTASGHPAERPAWAQEQNLACWPALTPAAGRRQVRNGACAGMTGGDAGAGTRARTQETT